MINKRGKIAVGEILVLVVAIFAFAWMIGGVNAGGEYGEYGFGDLVKEVAKVTPEDIAKKITLKGVGEVVKNFGIIMATYFTARSISKQIGVGGKEDVIAGTTAAAQTGVYIATRLGVENWLLNPIFRFGPNPITLATFVITTAIFYRGSKTKTVRFDCKTWDAPSGGDICGECNKQGILPCSEYQCHALGKSCVIKEGACVWNNKRNTQPPIISLNYEALLEGYEYKDKNERGVKLVKSGSECADAFTPIGFGIDTDKPAVCKMDIDREKSFEEMGVELNGKSYNHTYVFSMPGADALNSEIPEEESLEIKNDGKYDWYIRCQDRNGNENPAEFVLKFCVDAGPDLNSPLIVYSNLQETSYIKNNQEEIDFSVYTDKPSQCKWTKQDKSYDEMENIMSCSESIVEMNLQGTYACSTKLTGLTNSENKIYVKCKSYPLMEEGKRVANEESIIFTLQGTSELLKIDSVTPSDSDGTIRGSTKDILVELKVKTLAGAREGIAYCKYGTTDDYESGLMFNTNAHEHTQTLTLDEGRYTYYIQCVDDGGNEATATTSFEVETDDGAPTVVRVFKRANDLEIATSEKADCVYSTIKNLKCDYLYTTGSAMTSLDGLKHSVGWDTSSNYYIKCKDEYGNQPTGDCSIIVKPSEF